MESRKMGEQYVEGEMVNVNETKKEKGRVRRFFGSTAGKVTLGVIGGAIGTAILTALMGSTSTDIATVIPGEFEVEVEVSDEE